MFLFIAIHSVFFGLEKAYQHYCLSTFWMSMITAHSRPCEVLRELSSLTRGANITLLTLLVGAVSSVVATVSQKVNDVIGAAKEKHVRPEET